TFNGMFRSADQGQTWVGVNAGLPNSEQPIVFALAVKGNDLYIGTSLYNDGVNFFPQVYSSSDNGKTWTPVGATIRFQLGPSTTGFPSVSALFVDGTKIYALTGIGLSVFEGEMWDEPAGIRGLPVGIRANSLIRAGDMLVLGTQGGVFVQSSDG